MPSQNDTRLQLSESAGFDPRFLYDPERRFGKPLPGFRNPLSDKDLRQFKQPLPDALMPLGRKRRT